jgi:hypothetical protein
MIWITYILRKFLLYSWRWLVFLILTYFELTSWPISISRFGQIISSLPPNLASSERNKAQARRHLFNSRPNLFHFSLSSIFLLPLYSPPPPFLFRPLSASASPPLSNAATTADRAASTRSADRRRGLSGATGAGAGHQAFGRRPARPRGSCLRVFFPTR